LRRTCHECCAEHCCETHPSLCVHGYILLLGIQRVARNPDRRSAQSGGLSLFTLAANVRPRHRFEARLRNELLANHAYSVCALSHPIECLFDCS
jgi:hypothetical protein